LQVSDSFFQRILVERSGDGVVVNLRPRQLLLSSGHDTNAEAPTRCEIYQRLKLLCRIRANAERDIFAIYFDRGHLETTSNQFSRKSTLARGQDG